MNIAIKFMRIERGICEYEVRSLKETENYGHPIQTSPSPHSKILMIVLLSLWFKIHNCSWRQTFLNLIFDYYLKEKQMTAQKRSIFSDTILKSTAGIENVGHKLEESPTYIMWLYSTVTSLTRAEELICTIHVLKHTLR